MTIRDSNSSSSINLPLGEADGVQIIPIPREELAANPFEYLTSPPQMPASAGPSRLRGLLEEMIDFASRQQAVNPDMCNAVLHFADKLEALVGPAPACEPRLQDQEKKDEKNVSRLHGHVSSDGRQHADSSTGDR